MGELEGDAAALTLGCEEPLGDGEPDALGVALREGQEAVALCDGVALREGHEAVALLETLAAADADGEPVDDADGDTALWLAITSGASWHVLGPFTKAL